MWRHEKDVEEYFVTLLKKEGYRDLDSPIQKGYLILDDLKQYLNKVCSLYEDLNIDSIISEITNIPGNLYEANRKFCKWISDGYTFFEDASISFSLIDFENIDNNIFRVSSQFRVTGQNREKIIDIVIFINGFPLVLFEIKNPNEISQGDLLFKAWEEFQNYSESVPDLFKYNAFLVVSNGLESKYGSLFSSFDHYYSWRKIDDEDEEIETNSVEKLVRGLLRRERLLEVLRDFIVFPSNTQKKIVCRYPQYFASTKALASIKKAMKPAGDGAGGICFGSTGCGKSYSMLFLSRLLLREIRPKPIIFVITDRLDLNNQMHKHFESAAGKHYLEAEVKVIDDEITLEKALKSSANIFVTNIQKFRENTGQLSDSNIICIVDEAHRSINNWEESQRHTDGKIQIGFGARLNNAFPNATFVGFTGTPLEITERIFGERIHQYDMKESIADGFTVGIVFKSVCLGNFKKSENFEKVLGEIDKSYKDTPQVNKVDIIWNHPSLIDAVVNDIIKHHETRYREGYKKAMVVCHDREIAFLIYQAFEKFRPEWISCEKIKLILSAEKNDSDAFKKAIGNSKDRQNWANKFKDDQTSLDIVIVADMLLTGFDVPSLDTMYIYKTITGHNLVQTISRVNRIYPKKTKGIIIDYAWQEESFYRDTVNEYCRHKDSDSFVNLDQIVEEFREYFEKLNYFFKDFASAKEFSNIDEALEYIQKNNDTEKQFVELFKDLQKRFKICVCELSESEKNVFRFYETVYSKFRFIYPKPRNNYLSDQDNQSVRDNIYLDAKERWESPEIAIVAGNSGVHTEIKQSFSNISKSLSQIRDFWKRDKIAEQVKKLMEQYSSRKGVEDLHSLLKKLKECEVEIVEVVNDIKNVNAERDSYFSILLEEYGEQEVLLELSEEVKNILEERKKLLEWFKDPRTIAQFKGSIKKLLKHNQLKSSEGTLMKLLEQAKEWDVSRENELAKDFWENKGFHFDY